MKNLHEHLHLPKSELDVTNTVDQNFDEQKLDTSADSKPESDVLTEHSKPIRPPASLASESNKEYVEKENEDNDFSVVEKGMELFSEERASLEEVTILATLSTIESPQVVEANPGVRADSEEYFQFHPSNDESGSNRGGELVVQDCDPKEDEQCSKESLMRELDSVTNLEAAFVSFHIPNDPEDYMENKANYKTFRKVKSLSLDEAAESVASEFLNMLGIDDSPLGLGFESELESPRKRLLREFEKDTLASGCSLFDFDMVDGEGLEYGFDASTPSGWGSLSEDFDFSYVIQDAEQGHQMEANGRNKTRAKVLEDLETEALMREWGLNEKAFQHSPSGSYGGFGSPVNLPPEEPLELPPLGDDIGPFLQTKDGGFLRLRVYWR